MDSVTLSVQAGEFLLICGESGCGKSTLLKLLKKELTPFGQQSGKILYNGSPLSEMDERTAASEIGFVLQDPESQIVTDMVWHELAFGLENLGLPAAVIRRLVAEMASYFGIEEWFHKRTAELSGGQKQILNLASVMVMQPKVLLLDEPTAQLDPIAAANFIATLQKLNREFGLTILLVEHRLEDVLPIADRVIVMENGSVVCADTPGKIGDWMRTHPDHPLAEGLPASARIFGLLKTEGECPLTVREGQNFIRQYQNGISSLPLKQDHPSGEVVLELKEIWFRYERDLPDILKGVSLTIYKGEHFCILGGNGAGKTTALGVMAGLLRAYRGKVIINGKKLNDYSENSLYISNIALLPQNPQAVFLEKTLLEDFMESCRTMCYGKDAEQEIFSVAEQLNIRHLLQMHPYDLSGGEQQKAALAKILLLKPKILLLDEPTKGIDAAAKLTLAATLRQLKTDGITIITVTHDVEFAAANADRCGMFFDGELVSTDSPQIFFTENSFYTTAANRIARGYYQNAVLCEEVATLCRINGRRECDEA